MNSFEALATAYRYPDPDHLTEVQEAVEAMPPGSARRAYEKFTDSISQLTLSEWEELHTRTLDLSPLFAPYIGYITWGENYHRGAFLASMNRAEFEAGIDPDGELADHLDPVLRYLGRVEEPLAELTEVVGPAVAKMHKALKKAEPKNPYNHLLAATRRVVDGELAPTGGTE
ncbi:MAG: nitrate reductase molybdenum cofactor assembly chaperone [Acidimicrobiia bacterium]